MHKETTSLTTTKLTGTSLVTTVIKRDGKLASIKIAPRASSNSLSPNKLEIYDWNVIEDLLNMAEELRKIREID